LLYAYIGTAVVIVILVGSVTTCVVWLSKKVSAGIREKTVDVISAYDVLLEKRSRELAQLEEAIRLKAAEAENQTQPAAVKFRPENDLLGSALVNAAERFASASYREAAVGETYRKIRDAFQYDPQQVLAQISQSAEAMAGGPATRLLEELHYDTVYRLSTLAGEDQQRLLEEALEGDALQLLTDYCAQNSSFRIIDFYDYLQSAAALEPQRPRLRVSPVYRGSVPEGVELVVDPDICEGFQIEVMGAVYDYCIKGRELS